MAEAPETNPRPSRRWSLAVAFLLAGVGLFLLNEAADSIHIHGVNVLVVVQVALGLGLLILAWLKLARII